MIHAPRLGTLATMFGIGLVLTTAACAGDLADDEATTPVGTATSALANTGSSVTGDACTVISGANKDKTGTINADGDCAGPWGMSECKNQDGTDSGKCKIGKVVGRPPHGGDLGAGQIGGAKAAVADGATSTNTTASAPPRAAESGKGTTPVHALRSCVATSDGGTWCCIPGPNAPICWKTGPLDTGPIWTLRR